MSSVTHHCLLVSFLKRVRQKLEELESLGEKSGDVQETTKRFVVVVVVVVVVVAGGGGGGGGGSNSFRDML